MNKTKPIISIFQYNVLSSGLSKGYYNFPNRLNQTLDLIESRLDDNPIICLQEVSRSWYKHLFNFFSNRNYNIIYDSYGNYKNDYMGVSVAYSNDIYKLNNKEIVHIGSCVNTNELINSYSYTFAKERPNTSIFTNFSTLYSKKTFNLSTYHMPCAYWNPKVMKLHTNTLIKETQVFSNKNNSNMIIAGDFNFTPDTLCYKMMINEYKSSYKESIGYNPSTFQKIKTNIKYKKTLDYIFHTSHFETIHVDNPYNILNTIFSNSKYPSDHLPLQVTLKLK
jgi:hypothetical protein